MDYILEDNNFLPHRFPFKVITSSFVSVDDFKVELRVGIKNSEDFCMWLKEFEEKTNTTWIQKKSRKCGENSRYALNRNYVCHHSSHRKKKKAEDVPTKKNLNCCATLSIRIKHDTKDVRYKDKFVKEGLCGIIELHWCHTHLVQNAEAWTWLRRSEETKNTFILYFNNGMSPSVAKMYHADLMLAKGAEELANSRTNPPAAWIYALHQKWTQTNFGGLKSGPEFFSILRQKAEVLEAAGCKIKFDDEILCITLLTPLMQRQLLSLDSSCSIFLDSSASCDAANSSLTMVLASTKAGAVPIGAAIHSAQNEDNYLRIFSMLSKQWNDLHEIHIENFMTDDSDAMRNALRSVFPSVPLLLCHFHVLQAVWRWLFNPKNNIKQQDRKLLISLFKNILYSKFETDVLAAVNELKTNTTVSNYPNYLNYIEKYLERKSEWCLAYRMHVKNLQHNTNNYAEATFRILKDVILTRLKAYNAISLMEYIANVMDPYYAKRLLDIAYSRQKKPYLIFDKYRNKAENILSSCKIEKFEGYYLVQSETDKGTFYEVDIGLCSCIAALQGAFCKHQCAVLLKFNVEFPNAPSLSPREKEIMFRVAVGSTCSIPNFLVGMMEINQPAKPNFTAETGRNESEPELSPNDANIISNEGACSTLNECENYIPKPSSGEDERKVLENFKCEMLRMQLILEANLTDKFLVGQTKKFIKKCQQVQTPMQLSKFFVKCTANLKSPYKRKIKVQPTSISRRKHSISRGSLRQRCGRPREDEKKSKKRKHNLGKNIEMEQPNAKSHGDCH